MLTAAGVTVLATTAMMADLIFSGTGLLMSSPAPLPQRMTFGTVSTVAGLATSAYLIFGH